MSADTYAPFEPYCEDNRPVPVTPYERTLAAFLDELFLAYPVFATQVGDHRFDYRWPDLSGTGRLARIELLRRWRDVFDGLDAGGLTADERIDRGVLVEAIDAFLFDEVELREDTWDPLGYVTLLGSGLFPLLAREYAPWHHRGAAFAVRLEHLPGIVVAARANLLGFEGRPVSRLHAETALEQIGGISELIDEAVATADRFRHDEDAWRIPDRLAAVVPAALAALEDLRSFIATDVMLRAQGEGRLGPALFDRKLRHTLGSDLSREEMVRRARRDVARVRAEMVRLARELWPAWLGDEQPPALPGGAAGDDRAAAAVENELVRRALDAIGREHRTAADLLEYCSREVARIERFVRRNRMIGLPREPLGITWTPTFMRAYGGAFLDAPGPLEKGQRSLFWVTPPGDDWPPARIESQLREDNDRMLRLLCIHEAVPGHYLQLSWSNRCPSLTRAVFGSGVFAEGWAVYITQVMMDVGYGRRDPALMLVHWKFFLRAVLNSLLDAAIHCDGMSEEEAMALMVETGFQEEQEARAKYLRARLTSTQLSTYYIGSEELWDVELEARRRAAIENGGTEADVPEPRVVGGLPDTPGFDLRAHLEAVVSHGSPPIRWMRRILFGDAAEPLEPHDERSGA
jgi:uncharacterized protein (DUF885 family)